MLPRSISRSSSGTPIHRSADALNELSRPHSAALRRNICLNMKAPRHCRTGGVPAAAVYNAQAAGCRADFNRQSEPRIDAILSIPDERL